MREIKSELVDVGKRHKLAVLQNIPHHHSLVKANRFLFVLVFALMALVFVLGFLLFPSNDALDNFNKQVTSSNPVYMIENPVLTAEINALKGQFVGLISGSIESKLRALEESVRDGSIKSSLGTIHDLRNDVKVLQSYSNPVKTDVRSEGGQANEALLQEVSQLKTLIYLTLTSCGLMIAALAGFWVRNRFRLSDQSSIKRAAMLGKHK